MAKQPEIELIHASMHVGIGHRDDIKIEAYFSFHTTWRGHDAAVSLIGDRYTYGDGELSDWRVYCDRAIEGRYTHDDIEGVNHGALTDLARKRLGDMLKPHAMAWFDTDAAVTEAHRAFYHACVREVKNTPAYDFNRDRGDKLVNTFGEFMGDLKWKFEQFNDAFKNWVDANQEVD